MTQIEQLLRPLELTLPPELTDQQRQDVDYLAQDILNTTIRSSRLRRETADERAEAYTRAMDLVTRSVVELDFNQ